jgi:hypothetical protein
VRREIQASKGEQGYAMSNAKQALLRQDAWTVECIALPASLDYQRFGGLLRILRLCDCECRQSAAQQHADEPRCRRQPAADHFVLPLPIMPVVGELGLAL